MNLTWALYQIRKPLLKGRPGYGLVPHVHVMRAYDSFDSGRAVA